MSVLVVRVVQMAMIVFQGLVRMLVLVVVYEVDDDADRHQHSTDDEESRDGLTEYRDPENGTNEGRDRKVGACPGGADVAQGDHEENEADAIPETRSHRSASSRLVALRTHGRRQGGQHLAVLRQERGWFSALLHPGGLDTVAG